MIPKIILEAIAASIVFIELFRSNEKKYRRILLLLAALMIFGSTIFTWVDHKSAKKSEKERAADLLTIQKMDSSLRDLCFELELTDVDSLCMLDISFQIATSIFTMDAGTGLFADYIIIGHDVEKGWFLENSTFQRFRNVTFDLDDLNNRLRFILSNFGFSASWKLNRAGWEPNNIADLGRVRLGLSAHPLNIDDNCPYEGIEWCAIKRVKIYANDYQPHNLLAIAERNIKPANAVRGTYFYFLPVWAGNFANPDAREFTIEPLRIRDAIINSL